MSSPMLVDSPRACLGSLGGIAQVSDQFAPGPGESVFQMDRSPQRIVASGSLFNRILEILPWVDEIQRRLGASGSSVLVIDNVAITDEVIWQRRWNWRRLLSAEVFGFGV